MTSKYFVGLVAGLALAGAATGCGDDSAGTGGGGGEGGSGTTTTSGVTVTSSTSTGTTTGDGNNDVATAVEMDENEGVQFAEGDLFDNGELEGDVDFFKFTITTAGAYYIGSDAKPDSDEYADGYVDLVVALHDSTGTKLAENDDPFPRNSQDSSMYVKLEPGTYYLSATEFCSTTTDCPADYFANIDFPGYVVFVSPLDPADNGTVVEGPNESTNNAQPDAAAWEFEPVPDADPGVYFLTLAYGDFPTAADVDGYVLTVPNDIAIANDGRPNLRLAGPPSGVAGNGSSRNLGLVEVIDLSTDSVLARFDYGAEPADIIERDEPFAPVVAGGQYLIRVGDGGASTGGTLGNYYFVLGGVSEVNPVETDEAGNDSASTPEALVALPASGGGDGYFVEGDITTAGTDVDHFQIDVPSPLNGQVLFVACASRTGGSGLVDFKATVLDGTGAPLSGATGTETATESIFLQDIAPGSNTELIVKVEATSQNPAIPSGKYYRCGFVFGEPTP